MKNLIGFLALSALVLFLTSCFLGGQDCSLDNDCSDGSYCWDGDCLAGDQYVDFSSTASCALTAAGTLECWGYNYDPDRPNGPRIEKPTEGGFVKLINGFAGGCGLKADGSAHCFGIRPMGYTAPELQLSDMDRDRAESCGITFDQRLFCWSNFGETPEIYEVEGKYRSVSVYNYFWCAVSLENELRCIDDDQTYNDQLHVPEMQVRVARLGSSSQGNYIVNICALDPNGNINCFDLLDESKIPHLEVEGDFVDITQTSYFVCGLREDGSVECFEFDPSRWEFEDDSDELEEEEEPDQSPDGLGGLGGLGDLGSDGSIEITSQPPAGERFRLIDGTSSQVCGITVDGLRVHCWGDGTSEYP